MEKKERRQITTSLKLQIIQTVKHCAILRLQF
ncbi:hypothetical protein T09_5802 [Trichinella sp. T9]|nr:hypothetical protein T09_5802 [Trichinella sp. T9]